MYGEVGGATVECPAAADAAPPPLFCSSLSPSSTSEWSSSDSQLSIVGAHEYDYAILSCASVAAAAAAAATVSSGDATQVSAKLHGAEFRLAIS